MKDLLYAPIAPSPPAPLERRVHRMEHDRVGEPLRVQRTGVALAGQADPLASPEDEGEDDMPKGQYDRSKSKPRAAKKAGEPATQGAGGQGAAPSPEKGERRSRAKPRAGKKRKVARKERAGRAPRSNGAGARFGVFSDGSVQIDAEGCQGNLGAADARLLVEFVKRLDAGRAR